MTVSHLIRQRGFINTFAGRRERLEHHPANVHIGGEVIGDDVVPLEHLEYVSDDFDGTLAEPRIMAAVQLDPYRALGVAPQIRASPYRQAVRVPIGLPRYHDRDLRRRAATTTIPTMLAAQIATLNAAVMTAAAT